MGKRPPKTVLEIAVAKGGIRKGLRVCTFIAQWTIAQQQLQQDLGRVPTLEEAAAWWKEPQRTWFHRQAEFREVFDLCDTPEVMATAAIDRFERRLERGDVGTAIAQLGAMVPA
jgi:hypothetical protein